MCIVYVYGWEHVDAREEVGRRGRVRERNRHIYLLINNSCNWHYVKSTVGSFPDLEAKFRSKLLQALFLVGEGFLYCPYLVVASYQEKL